MRNAVGLMVLVFLAALILGCSVRESEPAAVMPVSPSLAVQESNGEAAATEQSPESEPVEDANDTADPAPQPFTVEVVEGFIWRDYMPGDPRPGVLAIVRVTVTNNSDKALTLDAASMTMQHEEENEARRVTFSYRSRQLAINEAAEKESNTITVPANQSIQFEFVTRSGPEWEPDSNAKIALRFSTDADEEVVESDWILIEATY